MALSGGCLGGPLVERRIIHCVSLPIKEVDALGIHREPDLVARIKLNRSVRLGDDVALPIIDLEIDSVR